MSIDVCHVGLLYFAKRNETKLYFAKRNETKLYFAKRNETKLYFAKRNETVLCDCFNSCNINEPIESTDLTKIATELANTTA